MVPCAPGCVRDHFIVWVSSGHDLAITRANAAGKGRAHVMEIMDAKDGEKAPGKQETFSSNDPDADARLECIDSGMLAEMDEAIAYMRTGIVGDAVDLSEF